MHMAKALPGIGPFVAMAEGMGKYYSQPHQPQAGGSFTTYKSGWRPYQSQNGRGFLSSLGSWLKPMASTAAKNIGRAVKTVAPVVGKKLMKIGMRSLKDWANQKQLNEAIQANLRQTAAETADQYLDTGEVGGGPPEKQTGSGRRRRRKRAAPPRRDCFSKRPRL
jgi:hypothetical protein